MRCMVMFAEKNNGNDEKSLLTDNGNDEKRNSQQRGKSGLIYTWYGNACIFFGNDEKKRSREK